MVSARFLRLIVFSWALAELLAFSLVAHWVGIGGALLAGLATTLLGALLIRQLGAAAFIRLRAAVAGRGGGAEGDLLEGTLRAFSAAALLLPGFLSDAVGLALAVPAVRSAARRRLAGQVALRRARAGHGRGAPRVVDLAPDEWSARTAATPDGGAIPRS